MIRIQFYGMLPYGTAEYGRRDDFLPPEPDQLYEAQRIAWKMAFYDYGKLKQQGERTWALLQGTRCVATVSVL